MPGRTEQGEAPGDPIVTLQRPAPYWWGVAEIFGRYDYRTMYRSPNADEPPHEAVSGGQAANFGVIFTPQPITASSNAQPANAL